MEKIWEDKEFHGDVSFFKNVVIRLGSLVIKGLTMIGAFVLTGDMTMVGDIALTGSIVLNDVGISREGAGSLQINSGVFDTLRDLTLRTFYATTINVSTLVSAYTHNTAESVTPDDSQTSLNQISEGVTAVDVQAVTNDVNDFIVLPLLANVPLGHTIKIACNAGGAFELRTPASSQEKINTVDSDGVTKEYLCTDTEMITITSMGETDGWVATALSALGAVVVAVVPDA